MDFIMEYAINNPISFCIILFSWLFFGLTLVFVTENHRVEIINIKDEYRNFSEYIILKYKIKGKLKDIYSDYYKFTTDKNNKIVEKENIEYHYKKFFWNL